MFKPTARYMIDLFAGCGGLSLGMERAGFSPLLFSEINQDAADTYEINRPDARVIRVGDIHSLDNAMLRRLKGDWASRGIARVDLVCGGPPCQGYSGIGHRRSHAVERSDIPSNRLYEQMLRVIREVEPRVFLFENVRGLMVGRWTKAGKKGEIFETVWGAFSSLENYVVKWSLLQAKDYGVPQNRPRLFIVGIHKDQNWSSASSGDDAVRSGLLPSGTEEAPDLIDVLSDLVDTDPVNLMAGISEKYPRAAESSFQREIRTDRRGKLARKGQAVTEQKYSRHSPAVRAKFEYMRTHGGKIPPRMQTKKFAQRVLPARWGPEGPNITATSLPDDFIHFAQSRTLTVREWARLQCFPDWYQFKGPRTTGGHRRAGQPSLGNWERDVPRYTQIGNAVPVKLAEAVGQHFFQLLARTNVDK